MGNTMKPVKVYTAGKFVKNKYNSDDVDNNKKKKKNLQRWKEERQRI
jgi:hypothetical protein|tara:strand:+ start:96 stop:236 length:141 start_codon:yes stop_codon:yes gene_type:complete